MKYKRLLGYGALGLTLIAVGVAFIKPVSTNSILFRARAANLNNLSVTFSRSTGTQTVVSTNYYYTSGTTSLGNTFYLRNASNVPIYNSSYVAAMCGTWDKGSVEPELNFTASNSGTSGTSLFEFKNIKSISAVSDSANTRSLTVLKSQDGSNWTSAGTLDVTSSGGTNTDVSGAKYIKLTYSGTYTVKLSSFTINYSCSDTPEVVTLSSISVTGQTTEFYVGDSFEFGGTVTAHYSDSSTVDITSSATFTGYDMDEEGEQTVTVSYTEDDITKTTTYDIEVTEAGEDVSGTYSGTYTNTLGAIYALTLSLNKNGSGTFTAVNTSTESQTNATSFTWTYENSVLTLTKTSQNVSTSIRIFTGNGTYFTTNSTGTFTNSTLNITLYTGNSTSSAISISLTK